MALKSIRQSIFGLIVQIRRGSVCYIGGSDLLPPPLSREEELALMRRCNAGDSGARATLIERNLRLVVYISRKFENTGISIEDLISIGAIGLIKAVNSFDPEIGERLADTAERRYTVVGIYERLDNQVEGYSCPGYIALTRGDGNGAITAFLRSAKAPIWTIWAITAPV